MKKSGQRQEVVFLALAVAVLAIAVGLFMAVRASDRGGKESPATPAQEQAEEETGEEPSAESATRDPFESQDGSAATAATATSPAAEMKLVGVVMHGNQLLAVIRRGDRRYYAKLGDRVAGYTVVGIGDDRAILTKAEEKITLTLRVPQPEEEE